MKWIAAESGWAPAQSATDMRDVSNYCGMNIRKKLTVLSEKDEYATLVMIGCISLFQDPKDTNRRFSRGIRMRLGEYRIRWDNNHPEH